jgi:Spy/CpxP family protein refolding chaperone
LAVDIKAEMWKDPMNVDKINKLIDQKYDLKKEKTKIIVKAYDDIKNILTADQKAKLKDVCAKEDMIKKCMKCPMMSGKMMSGKRMN